MFLLSFNQLQILELFSLSFFFFPLSIHRRNINARCLGLTKALAILGKQIFTRLGCLQLSALFKCCGQNSGSTKPLTNNEQPDMQCCQIWASESVASKSIHYSWVWVREWLFRGCHYNRVWQELDSLHERTRSAVPDTHLQKETC